jgi:predicted nucleic acid-binding protein
MHQPVARACFYEALFDVSQQPLNRGTQRISPRIEISSRRSFVGRAIIVILISTELGNINVATCSVMRQLTTATARILAINRETAFAWGDLMAEAKRRGIGLSSMDCLLAATASAHGLILATRNTKDFRDLGLTPFDPWGACR